MNARMSKMTKEELIARLGKYEWNDIEFKKAQRGVPNNAYETVSAFDGWSSDSRWHDCCPRERGRA